MIYPDQYVTYSYTFVDLYNSVSPIIVDYISLVFMAITARAGMSILNTLSN